MEFFLYMLKILRLEIVIWFKFYNWKKNIWFYGILRFSLFKICELWKVNFGLNMWVDYYYMVIKIRFDIVENVF